MMGLLKKSLCLFWTLLLVFFVDAGEQDVGSPLRVAQCRATCLQKVSRRWFFFVEEEGLLMDLRIDWN